MSADRSNIGEQREKFELRVYVLDFQQLVSVLGAEIRKLSVVH